MYSFFEITYKEFGQFFHFGYLPFQRKSYPVEVHDSLCLTKTTIKSTGIATNLVYSYSRVHVFPFLNKCNYSEAVVADVYPMSLVLFVFKTKVS